MVNSLINKEIKKQTKTNISVDSLLNDVYLLPKWEMIKSFNLPEITFLLKRKSVNYKLYRKFSSKNKLEKYQIRTADKKVVASMDLKVYKDSVYVINIDVASKFQFDRIAGKIIQVAVEKALYNTTEQEVVINLTSGLLVNYKIRKFIVNNEFIAEEAQSNYEKDLFGETYTLKVNNNSKWMKKIKMFPFLINK